MDILKKRVAKVICLAGVMIVLVVAVVAVVSECRAMREFEKELNEECVRIQAIVDEMKLSNEQNLIQF